MHGTIHELDEPFAGHVQDRCTAVPLLEGETLTSIGMRTGEAEFRRLSAEDQEYILGPGKFALYQAGRIRLADTVRYSDDRDWGPSRTEKTLTQIRDDLANRETGPPPGGGGGDEPPPKKDLAKGSDDWPVVEGNAFDWGTQSPREARGQLEALLMSQRGVWEQASGARNATLSRKSVTKATSRGLDQARANGIMNWRELFRRSVLVSERPGLKRGDDEFLDRVERYGARLKIGEQITPFVITVKQYQAGRTTLASDRLLYFIERAGRAFETEGAAGAD